MKEEELTNVVRLLASGEKIVNLKERELIEVCQKGGGIINNEKLNKKIYAFRGWKIEKDGWTMEFKTSE
jgi:hypothetical protein